MVDLQYLALQSCLGSLESTTPANLQGSVIQEELDLHEELQDAPKTLTSFDEMVKFNFVSDVWINVLNYKRRCWLYLKKIYTIFEVNFLIPYFDKTKESKEFCDPYKAGWYTQANTNKEMQKLGVMNELQVPPPP